MRRHLQNHISYTLLITIVSVFACSCSLQSNKNDVVINEMEASLKSTNKTIIKNKELIFQSLKEKTTEYSTKERAEIWLPKTEEVQKISAKTYDYFQELKKRYDSHLVDAREILTRLIKYKESILSIDSFIRDKFTGLLPGFLNKYDSSDKSIHEFQSMYLENPPLHKKGILAKIQNDILVTENKIVTYCKESIGSVDGVGFFDSYSAIVGQNSNILKPGSVLTINAGVGTYSRAAQPKIRINGIETPLSEEGFATLKLKTPKNPGDYIVPVVISYFNQITGKEEIKSINIDYTVTKPCDQ